MNYFLKITTVLYFLIRLTKADTECTNDKVCMDLKEDNNQPCVKIFTSINDHKDVQFCNANKTKICCVPPYIPKTISEQSEFMTIIVLQLQFAPL